jgi:hypothetical protein
MRLTAPLFLAVGALSLGLSISTVHATPSAWMTPLAAASSGTVVKVRHFACVRRCLRHTHLPPWACRRRCFGGGDFGGHCVRRCVRHTHLPPWVCRRRCFGGFGGFSDFDGDSGFGYSSVPRPTRGPTWDWNPAASGEESEIESRDDH